MAYGVFDKNDDLIAGGFHTRTAAESHLEPGLRLEVQCPDHPDSPAYGCGDYHGCPHCGGSGGGLEPENKCHWCRGSG